MNMMKSEATRWIVAILLQMGLSLLLGLFIPWQISLYTGSETLWMLPIGLVLGCWLGGWPIWPASSQHRWYCLSASAVACVLLILLMLIGAFGPLPPFLAIPLFPLMGFDLMALWLKKRSAGG